MLKEAIISVYKYNFINKTCDPGTLVKENQETKERDG